jgi:hypothetical protein
MKPSMHRSKKMGAIPMVVRGLGLFGLAACTGCGVAPVDVVDLDKVLTALVAVLDEGAKTGNAIEGTGDAGGTATLAASSVSAEVSTTAEIQQIEPEKQDLAMEASFLTKFAAKLNEVKAMESPVGVAMTSGGEIIGFKDPNLNNVQDFGEEKEFSVTIDPSNKRLVASDNNGYHRPHGYGFSPSGMMMGYMLGSMMGRQGSFYSGPMAAAKPNFNNTTMSPPNYHKSAVSSVRTRSSSSGSGISSSSSSRTRTGSKGFSFGK